MASYRDMGSSSSTWQLRVAKNRNHRGTETPRSQNHEITKLRNQGSATAHLKDFFRVFMLSCFRDAYWVCVFSVPLRLCGSFLSRAAFLKRLLQLRLQQRLHVNLDENLIANDRAGVLQLAFPA